MISHHQRYVRVSRRAALCGGAMALAAFAGTALYSGRLSAASPDGDAALARFLSAASASEASALAEPVIKAGASFDEAWTALKRGRTYRSDVAKGLVRASHTAGDSTFNYQLDVPASYDAAKPYQLRVQLHGGVGRPDPTPRGNGIGALAGAEQIYLLPTAWSAAEWWTDAQLNNLRVLLDTVKRTYNVDENRIVLSGVSDGGTAAYYFSMRETTPFASFLPLNGAIPVLRNTSMRVDGELFMNNMVNKPFFIVNGGNDPLYPTTLVEPYVRNMEKGGVEVKYLPQPDAVHNTAWWPDVKDTYEAFVTAHPRKPYPDTLTWESDLRSSTGRAHWLVIDRLVPPQRDAAALPDVNDRIGAPVPDFGVRANGQNVTAVTKGSNADSFGLQPGDVVSKIDSRVVPKGMDFVDLFVISTPGSPMTLTVMRGTQTVELKGTYQPTPLVQRTPFFSHARPSGRVDLTRQGNTVTVTSRGVGAFTLLLSPDQFDFSQPVKVVADGRTVFDGRVTKDLATLLKWAARDNDRSMLFAAELPITLTQ